MNNAGDQDFISRKILAEFGSLLPWFPRVGRHDGREVGATSDRDPVVGSATADPAFVLAALTVSACVARALFDESPISAAVFDPEGRIIRANRAFGTMLGREPDGLTGGNIEELMNPDDVAASRELRRQLAEGTLDVFETEARFTPANRSEIWTRVSGRLQPFPYDQPRRIFVHVVEILAPKRVQEENLRELETIFLSSWGATGNL